MSAQSTPTSVPQSAPQSTSQDLINKSPRQNFKAALNNVKEIIEAYKEEKNPFDYEKHGENTLQELKEKHELTELETVQLKEEFKKLLGISVLGKRQRESNDTDRTSKKFKTAQSDENPTEVTNFFSNYDDEEDLTEDQIKEALSQNLPKVADIHMKSSAEWVLYFFLVRVQEIKPARKLMRKWIEALVILQEINGSILFGEESKKNLVEKLCGKGEYGGFEIPAGPAEIIATEIQRLKEENYQIDLQMLTTVLHRVETINAKFKQYVSSQQIPELKCLDFETTCSLDIIQQRFEIFFENKKQQREKIWEGHKAFKPKNWDVIPMNSEKRTFQFMDFAFEKSLHWEDRSDSFFDDMSNHKCLLAATASGKTASIIRKLTKSFGFLYTCDTGGIVNENSRDSLLGIFTDMVKMLSQNEIIAFGNSYAQLVIIAKYISLLLWAQLFKQNDKTLSPLAFLWFQTNGSTVVPSAIYNYLVINKYYLHDYKTLAFYANGLKTKLQKNIEFSGPFPTFVDEAQLFCPNAYTLLEGKITVTPYNTPRENDLYSLLLNAITLNEENSDKIGSIIVTGTAFSNDALVILQSLSVSKQHKQVDICIGQDLIETKDEFIEKMKTLMKIPKDLENFINSSILSYLPMRRRVFANICAEILCSKGPEGYKSAFDKCIRQAVENLVAQAENLKLRLADKSSVSTLKILKLCEKFYLNDDDSSFLKKLFPMDASRVQEELITSGFVPYFSESRGITSFGFQLSMIPLSFQFDEPLCQMVLKQLCVGITLEPSDYLDLFTVLLPKPNENQAKFDAAFSVLLQQLSGLKFSCLPFLRFISSNFKLDDSFKNATSNFQIMCTTNKSSLYRYLSQKVKFCGNPNNLLTLLKKYKDNNCDSLYWEVFKDLNLQYLLVGVCYFPSVEAHSDCWIFLYLGDNKYGFVSFGFKVHRDLKHARHFKEKNSFNTYQCCMRYAYSTCKSKSSFTKKDLSNDDLLTLTDKKNNPIVTIPKNNKGKNDLANSYPCLPIAISLHKKFSTMLDEAHNHAVQINTANFNAIFEGTEKILFP